MPRLLLPCVVALAFAAGCRDDRTVGRDTATASARPDTAARAELPPVPGWEPEFGDALLVATDDPGAALLVEPDSLDAGIQPGAMAALLGRDGRLQAVTLGGPPDDTLEACAGLPALRVVGQALHPWSVGFVGGRVAPVTMDSSSIVTGADSARLVAELARLASAQPGGTARFHGLPFAVVTLWRFPVPGGQAVAATLLRRLSQESDPREERTLLVVERDSGQQAYAVAYSERSEGNEDVVESAEFLGAALVGRTPVLVVARDFGDAMAYAILRREARQRWVRLWASPRARC